MSTVSCEQWAYRYIFFSDGDKRQQTKKHFHTIVHAVFNVPLTVPGTVKVQYYARSNNKCDIIEKLFTLLFWGSKWTMSSGWMPPFNIWNSSQRLRAKSFRKATSSQATKNNINTSNNNNNNTTSQSSNTIQKHNCSWLHIHPERADPIHTYSIHIPSVIIFNFVLLYVQIFWISNNLNYSFIIWNIRSSIRSSIPSIPFHSINSFTRLVHCRAFLLQVYQFYHFKVHVNLHSTYNCARWKTIDERYRSSRRYHARPWKIRRTQKASRSCFCNHSTRTCTRTCTCRRECDIRKCKCSSYQHQWQSKSQRERERKRECKRECKCKRK